MTQVGHARLSVMTEGWVTCSFFCARALTCLAHEHKTSRSSMIVSGKACDPRVAFSSVEGSFISTAMLEGEHHAARRAGSVVGLAAARRCTHDAALADRAWWSDRPPMISVDHFAECNILIILMRLVPALRLVTATAATNLNRVRMVAAVWQALN